MHPVCKKYKFLLFIASFLLIIGCKSEDPYPELRDPIYLDLVKVHKELDKALTDEKKSLAGAFKEKASAQFNSVDYAVAGRAIKKIKKKIKVLDQEVRYFAIRSERRRVEGRRSYKLAFKKGESWPKPEEFKAYLVNKKLVDIDLNWNKRVPKLFKQNPNYTPPQRAEKAAE